MQRTSVAVPDARKSGPKSYRVGQFLITRSKSRWRICARHSQPPDDFSTLGGAIAWCRQHLAESIMSQATKQQPR
ncbi:MAG TPA: hypothetical protein VHT93_04240 [Pseudolabrys sp.]|jgi:hypothetical protein|nr:hypothetical protein [Pseudolabrys sp.]